MAEQDEGSKTELPTDKRLRDARKKGDVPKSPDVGITLGFFFALLLIWLVFDDLVVDLTSLIGGVLASPGAMFEDSLHSFGKQAIGVFIDISVLVVVPLALFGLVVEFLVVGPVATTEKFKPKMSNLNPVEGLKRMFGADNLVELLKSIIKTIVLAAIGFFMVRSVIGDLVLLPNSRPEFVISAIWYLILRIFGWASAAYLLFMFVDAGYQKYSFTKKMKMSMRDIRDELKNVEGDPLLKGARRELGTEWAQEAPNDAARSASVLVVNPIHVAIAIQYDKEKTKIPLITAKGEEEVARGMRAAAAETGVPVLRNEQLARALLANESYDNFVPRELFDIIAEVIIWAHTVRENMASSSLEVQDRLNLVTPGEDLTNYSFVNHKK